MNSGEVYDPETNQWTFIPPMNSSRSGLGVVAYEGEIYALGGFNGVARMNSAEKYCPRTNQWRPIAEFCSPRSNFAVKVRISGCLFVVVAISMFQGMGRKGFKIDLSPIQINFIEFNQCDFVGTFG